MSVVQLDNIDMRFRVQRGKQLADILRMRKGVKEISADQTIDALRGVSFTLKDGDRLAIIGHNGAGKSTLLKTVMGIYPPTAGTLQTDGRISGMFELATGFEMEQSGWTNIYLRGLMLGETPKQIRSKMREIADFSELGDFLDMPVKYYSSGMFIRLAFSVSTAIEPEILLLDEIIASGDAAFIQKANVRLQELVDRTHIMMLVTHSMESAVSMCNRCIWLERGSIRMDGTPEEVTGAYLKNSCKERMRERIQ